MPRDNRTLELLLESQSMKKLPRMGWLTAYAPHESLADHSFGTAVIALVLARMERLGAKEESELIRRALLHDLHEARIGDLSHLQQHYVNADYRRAEKEMLEETHLHKEIEVLKYDHLEILANDADKLDLLLVALANRKAGNRNMGTFIKTALSHILSASGKKLAKMAMQRLK